MASPEVNGTLSLLTQSSTTKSDPQRGARVVTIYRGTGAAQAVSLANYLLSIGVQYDFEARMGIYTITVNDGTFVNAADTWELIGDAERIDLFQNPLWANDITDDQMGVIRAYLAEDAKAAVAFADAALSGLAGGVVERAYVRYQSGNTEFENDAYGGGYVLKHTYNVPARWTGTFGAGGTGLIYTTGALLSEVGSGWVYNCPAYITSQIGSIPSPSPRLYYTIGWKKGRNTTQTAANNRVNITVPYVLEQWSVDDYT